MTMAVAPFFFQILLAGWKGAPSGAVNQSVFVEVSPEMISLAPVSGEKEKREHEFAEEIARRVAKEIIESQFASASKPADSIAQIGSLPDGLREKSPTLQRLGVRAWLL
jgi:hypothetical protein